MQIAARLLARKVVRSTALTLGDLPNLPPDYQYLFAKMLTLPNEAEAWARRLEALYDASAVVLVGHSGGGAIAANVLGRHPDVADALQARGIDVRMTVAPGLGHNILMTPDAFRELGTLIGEVAR